MNAIFAKLLSLLLSLWFTMVTALPSGSEGRRQLAGLPPYENGSACEILYDAGSGREPDWLDASTENDNAMQVVRDASLSYFYYYCDRLQKRGYTQVFSNRIENNEFRAFRAGERQFYLSYCGNTREVRLMDDSCSSRLDTFGYRCDPGERTTVYQFGFPYYDESFCNDNTLYSSNGMLYVVRLCDNKLIIIDGGSVTQSSDANAVAFMDFLHAITRTAPDEKISVALWYGTHGHSDHISFFSKVLSIYSAQLEVERLMFNYWSYSECEYDHRVDWFREQCNRLYPQAKYCKVRGGFTCSIADATLEILCTHEDVADAETGHFPSEDGNDGSSVLKLTIAGSSFLFLGDAAAVQQDALLKKYTALTLSSTVVQASHHMLNWLEALYGIIRPSLVMAPQSKERSVSSCEAYTILRRYVKPENFFFANEGTFGFTPDGNGNVSVQAYGLATGVYDGSDIIYDFPTE